MVEEGKHAAIKAYLDSLFPGCGIHLMHSSETGLREQFVKHALLVRIDTPEGSIKHRVRIEDQFIADHTSDQIISELNAWNLKDHLEYSGINEVTVTNKGISRRILQ